MRYTIGRDLGCDIPAPDDSVSRLHAELTFAGAGRIRVKDCGSSNGTWLVRDGVPQRLQQEEQEVLVTDVMRFGGWKIAVKDILEQIHQKHPLAAAAVNADPSLIRCSCGQRKRPEEYCTSCGQGPQCR